MGRSFKAVRIKKDPPGIDEAFKTDVDSCDRNQLKERIITIQNQIEESEGFLKTKPEIVELKEKLKLSQSSAKETIRHLKNRNRYVLQRMRDLGAV